MSDWLADSGFLTVHSELDQDEVAPSDYRLRQTGHIRILPASAGAATARINTGYGDGLKTCAEIMIRTSVRNRVMARWLRITV